MRPWVLGFWCALVLGGSLQGMAQQQQQQSGPRTLEGLLNSGEAQAPTATAEAAKAAVPAGRIQGAVARPKDGVQHPDLDAAWTEYDKQIETAAKAIEQAIERELSKAAEAGDLDAALKWKTAGEQFKKAGRIPEGLDGQKPRTPPKQRPAKSESSSESLVAEAQVRLAKAYEAVEKELVKSLDLEKATQVRSEKTSLTLAIGSPEAMDESTENATLVGKAVPKSVVTRSKEKPVIPSIAGKWVVRYSNGVLREYNFAVNGKVEKAEGGVVVKGTYRPEKSGFLVFVDGSTKLELWQQEDDGFAVDHYINATQYPTQPPEVKARASRP